MECDTASHNNRLIFQSWHQNCFVGFISTTDDFSCGTKGLEMGICLVDFSFFYIYNYMCVGRTRPKCLEGTSVRAWNVHKVWNRGRAGGWDELGTPRHSPSDFRVIASSQRAQGHCARTHTGHTVHAGPVGGVVGPDMWAEKELMSESPTEFTKSPLIFFTWKNVLKKPHNKLNGGTKHIFNFISIHIKKLPLDAF